MPARRFAGDTGTEAPQARKIGGRKKNWGEGKEIFIPISTTQSAGRWEGKKDPEKFAKPVRPPDLNSNPQKGWRKRYPIDMERKKPA